MQYVQKYSPPHHIIVKPDFLSQLSWMNISHEATCRSRPTICWIRATVLFLMGDKQEDQISAQRLAGLLAALEEEELSIETVTDMTD